MNDPRPNPDELLARVQAEESQSRRGKLKIFFGYAAGVGKTFAMLQAAQREKAAGVEVVVGYVEPHGRRETEALLEGLETIPFREIPYRGVTLREFDLDAALARHPQLILVDELAHTNVEGSRHAKRWQDVEELLDAGIDVWTTLNVQHIESLNDVIAQITGVIVRETLPDAMLERADEIELVDVTPEELIDRLQAGKVYLPTQAERALNNFFHRGNLVALRELSLRQAATRLHRDVDAARHDRAATGPWATTERLLVCVGPSPSSAKIIRTAKRMAAALGAEWMAVAVDTARDETKIGNPAAASLPQLRARRAARRRNRHAHRRQRRRRTARLRPQSQRHQDRRRQNRPTLVEALARRHGRRAAPGPLRRHRHLRHHRRRERIAAEPVRAAGHAPSIGETMAPPPSSAPSAAFLAGFATSSAWPKPTS